MEPAPARSAHKKLTFFFNGRHMRLTNIAGELIPQIVGAAKALPITGQTTRRRSRAAAQHGTAKARQRPRRYQ